MTHDSLAFSPRLARAPTTALAYAIGTKFCCRDDGERQMPAKKYKGGCLCGGVRYEVRGELRPVVACHCSQCRRTSGNFVTATNCAPADLVFESEKSLRWFRSSEAAERGFCGVCGGNLFWRPIGGDHVSIMAGTLDAPTGLRLTKHIFVADKSDYYELNDHAEKHARW
jgi:hypothetical protein